MADESVKDVAAKDWWNRPRRDEKWAKTFEKRTENEKEINAPKPDSKKPVYQDTDW